MHTFSAPVVHSNGQIDFSNDSEVDLKVFILITFVSEQLTTNDLWKVTNAIQGFTLINPLSIRVTAGP